MRKVLVALTLSTLLSGAGWQSSTALSANPTPLPPGGAGTPTPPIIVVRPPVLIPACQMTYRVTLEWSSGFVADVTIKNNSAHAIHHWQGRWTWPNENQWIHWIYTEAGDDWPGSWKEEGQAVFLDSYRRREPWEDYLPPIPPGDTITFKVFGMQQGYNRPPNDLRCIILD